MIKELEERVAFLEAEASNCLSYLSSLVYKNIVMVFSGIENESEGQDKENRSHSDWFLQRGMRHESEGGATTVCLVATWYTDA